jgi:2-haloacid dehalogenase
MFLLAGVERMTGKAAKRKPGSESGSARPWRGRPVRMDWSSGRAFFARRSMISWKRKRFAMRLTDFKALTFDCYGTLIDWESGMMRALAGLAGKSRRNLTRDLILKAHARHESAQQRQTPAKRYCDVLSVVYKRLAEEWGVSASIDECEDYGHSIRHWPAFADSPDALQYLKKFYKLIILSNVDNRSFSFSNAALGVQFDAIYTAEDIGSYKPADRNFTYMLEHVGDLGLAKTDILHTAESLFHDHVPARQHGIANCWIHRRHAEEGFGATMDPGQMPKIDFKFNSLAELAEAHRKANRESQ